MLAPPLAGSSAGWARWRVEGCGGRAREVPVLVLSFPAGGGRPRSRSSWSSPPHHRLCPNQPGPAACCCGCREALSGAGAARRAARSRRLLLLPSSPSSAPLPAGRAPASPPPPPGFPPTARARACSLLFPLASLVPCPSLSLDLLQPASPLPRPRRTPYPATMALEQPGRLTSFLGSACSLLGSARSLSARGRVLISGLLDPRKDHTSALEGRPPGP